MDALIERVQRAAELAAQFAHEARGDLGVPLWQVPWDDPTHICIRRAEAFADRAYGVLAERWRQPRPLRVIAGHPETVGFVGEPGELWF